MKDSSFIITFKCLLFYHFFAEGIDLIEPEIKSEDHLQVFSTDVFLKDSLLFVEW